MANYASVTIKIMGTAEDMASFHEDISFKRRFRYEVYDFGVTDDGILWETACSEARWSIASGMEDYLTEISNKHSLKIEAFSREGGMGFAEHITIINGTKICDETQDYYLKNLESFYVGKFGHKAYRNASDEEIKKAFFEESGWDPEKTELNDEWAEYGMFDEEFTITGLEVA